MKTLKLNEFVEQYLGAPNLATTRKGVLAAFGSMTFVYHDEDCQFKNERHVVDLTALDVDKIVRCLRQKASQGEDT